MSFLGMRLELWTHKKRPIIAEKHLYVIYNRALHRHYTDWTSKYSVGLITARYQSFVFDTRD